MVGLGSPLAPRPATPVTETMPRSPQRAVYEAIDPKGAPESASVQGRAGQCGLQVRKGPG